MKKTDALRKKGRVRGGVGRLSDEWHDGLCNGIIGGIFASYDKSEALLCESATENAGRRAMPLRRINRLRGRVAEDFDGSMARTAVLWVTDFLRRCTLRFYGVWMLSFAFYTTLVYLVCRYGMRVNPGMSYLLAIIASVVIGLILCPDGKTPFCVALLTSRTGKWLFLDFLGLRRELLYAKGETFSKLSVAFILGMATGGITFFLSPKQLLLFVLSVSLFYLTMVSPEAGYLVMLFSVPFLRLLPHPSISFGVFVLCVDIGFTVKCLRGKRTVRPGVTEWLLLLFSAVYLFGGLRNASGGFSADALIGVILMGTGLLSYFLLRTRDMVYRTAQTLVFSASLTALWGIGEYLLGLAPKGWTDLVRFPTITGRCVSFFDNPNVLGTYLCLCAPIALSLVILSRKKEQTRAFVSFVLIVVCLGFTFSRSAWVGFAAAMILMLFTCSRHALSVGLFAAVLIPTSTYLLPEMFLERVKSIGFGADSSVTYRFGIWRGCVAMLREYGSSGIGVGEAAFTRLYPKFAVAGAEVAYHAHSLWLQLLLALGIGGFAIFLVYLFFVFQRAFTSLRTQERNDGPRTILCGAISGVIGVLVQGLADNTWYNYRVLGLFFAVAGLVCACERIGRKKEGVI